MNNLQTKLNEEKKKCLANELESLQCLIQLDCWRVNVNNDTKCGNKLEMPILRIHSILFVHYERMAQEKKYTENPLKVFLTHFIYPMKTT